MCILTLQLLCALIDPCFCREILDVCAKLCLTALLHFPLPQLHTPLQVLVLRDFAGFPSGPDRTGDTTLSMDGLKKLTKTTLCAAETSPEGGFHGFSSYLLNQLFF